MAKVVVPSNKTIRLSHSSANLLRGCERRYVEYKVKGTKPDSDYVESNALSVGKAFHYIQEKGRHEPTSLSLALKECHESEDIGLGHNDYGLVAGMSKAYWEFHKQSKTKVVGLEYKIETDNVVGFVDLVSIDESGKWYIEDLKCFKGFYPSAVVGLANDPQLNLYAYHAGDIAKEYGLKLNKFAGAGLRVVTKSTAKQQKKETLSDLAKRISRLVKVHRIIIPAEELHPERTMELHEDLYLTANSLHNTSHEPTQNFNYCMNYFSPCPYWSKCHGRNYTESMESVQSRVETFQLTR